MIFDFDDFGANHVISDACQAHDCRKELDALHFANMDFKVTLFAIPDYMTLELLNWCKANSSWVELAVHGIAHTSNYECEKMTYEEFDKLMKDPLRSFIIDNYFVKLFKAPGWQISDDIFRWLKDNQWSVADQGYNDHRRPELLPAYVNYDGKFKAKFVMEESTMDDGNLPVETPYLEAWHGHTWNCVGNGIQETFDQVKDLVAGTTEFQFVTEVLQ